MLPNIRAMYVRNPVRTALMISSITAIPNRVGSEAASSTVVELSSGTWATMVEIVSSNL